MLDDRVTERRTILTYDPSPIRKNDAALFTFWEKYGIMQLLYMETMQGQTETGGMSSCGRRDRKRARYADAAFTADAAAWFWQFPKNQIERRMEIL